MTDTEIKALVERLRNGRFVTWMDALAWCYAAADALEALQTERDAALFDKAVAGGKVRVAEARAEKAEDKLQRIWQWCEAYPLDVFPEPQFTRSLEVRLEAGGITIDSVNASNMRHVLDGIRRIVGGDDRQT